MSYTNALIIEANRTKMKLCLDAFEMFSPETIVRGVDNLSDALKAIKKNKYELYFCDCDFPLVPITEDPYRDIKKGTFFDFYEELKKVHSDANIIMRSFHQEDVDRAKKLGVEAYIDENIRLNRVIFKQKPPLKSQHTTKLS